MKIASDKYKTRDANSLKMLFWKSLAVKRRIENRFSKKIWKIKKHYSHYELTKDLARLPIPSGSIVCIYSSLSKIGKIKGGPVTVIDALIEVFRDDTTLVFPTFTLPKGNMKTTLESGFIFDARNSPSTLGAIPEAARNFKGFVRSIHPTHSVVARGPLAEELTKDHYKSITPTGFGSPFFKMSFMENAYIILLGSPFGNFVSGHCVQDRLEKFPYRPYTEKMYESLCIGYDETEYITKSYAHDQMASKYRWDRDELTRKTLENRLNELGVIKYFKVGEAATLLINCVKLESALEELLNQGVTIFGTIKRLELDPETKQYIQNESDSYWRAERI